MGGDVEIGSQRLDTLVITCSEGAIITLDPTFTSTVPPYPAILGMVIELLKFL